MDITLYTLAQAVLKNKQALTAPTKVMPLTVPIEDPESAPAERSINILLARTPRSGMKGLVRIRQQLGLALTIGQLLTQAQHLPFFLLENVSLSAYRERCLEIQEAEDCLQVNDAATGESLDTSALQEPPAQETEESSPSAKEEGRP